jgi:hypothetical protein
MPVCIGFQLNRDGGIRTHGPFVPNEVRYQTAPHPEKLLQWLSILPNEDSTDAKNLTREDGPSHFGIIYLSVERQQSGNLWVEQKRHLLRVKGLFPGETFCGKYCLMRSAFKTIR